MSRYVYARFQRHDPTYRVKFREVPIGECWRVDPLTGRKRWHARLITDPTIIGKGESRDQAVDNAYQQVGGPG